MPRVGVVGATGAVGKVTLRLLAERGYDDVRAFASARSAGSRIEFGGEALVVEEATAGGAERRRSRPLPVLDRHGDVARARAARGRGRRGRGRQVVGVPAGGRRAARRARGERRAGARAPGHRRQPELLHDPADLRAEAARGGGSAAARARGDVPVGLRRRGRVDGPSRRRAAGRARPARGLGLRRRRVRGGGEAPARDAEDPRAAGAADQPDVRAGTGDGRARGGDLGRDRGAAVGRTPRGRCCPGRPVFAWSTGFHRRARQRKPRTCWSAGSARTRPRRTGSSCSSPATTWSRAPR